MPAEGHIGSQAPLWQVGGPHMVWRILVIIGALFAGALLLETTDLLGGDTTGFIIAAWVFGVFAGILLISAVAGLLVLRRMSAKVRRYADDAGFAFAVRDRQRTGHWRVGPNCDGAMSRDVVTGTVDGRALTSFLHQSYVSFRDNPDKASGVGTGHTVGVRVTVLELDQTLPSVELTPHRLPQVERRTLPTGPATQIGVPEIERDYHVATDDPDFAAALLSVPVVAALRENPRIAVRVSGSRLVALASPLSMVAGLEASVRLLTVLRDRLTELADLPTPPAATPRGAPAYAPPSAQRWQLTPFAGAIRDEHRGQLGDRPYLTFVHEQVSGDGSNRTVQRTQVIAVALPARLPRLTVRPEHALRRVAPSMAVREDVDIESDEFNNRFQVSADDRKYAVDVLNPRAVAALLAVPDFAWHIDGSDLVGTWPAGDGPLDDRLAALNTVAEHLPNHVVADHGWATEPDQVDNSTADVDQLPPLRAVHVVLATLVGIAIVGAGIPITRAITADDPPGSWAGALVWLTVITIVAVALTLMLGRVVDSVRKLNEANRG
jgi:hypothetical protein